MIIFLSSLVETGQEDFYQKNSHAPLPQSSNTHQLSILEGLRQYCQVYVINRLPIGAYPSRTPRKILPRQEFDGLVNIECNNLPLLRNPRQTQHTVLELEKCLSRNPDVEAIVAYMPFKPRMKALVRIKKKYPRIPIFAIIPDLVQHSYPKSGNPAKAKLIRIMRKCEGRQINRMAGAVDGFIYLAEAMHQELGSNHPYIIQEAIYGESLKEPAREHTHNGFTFTYCGKLNDENGVARLIEAFMMLPDSQARLVLCGTGVDIAKYQQMARSDSRIVFTGMLTHEQVVAYEQQSDVLVNPRFTSLDNAAYSFPSKLIEYLACGKPVISSRLAGITSDYDPHLFYVADDSVQALNDVMSELMNFPEEQLRDIGRENYRFVRNEKSSSAQGKEMYDFICKIGSEVRIGR